MGTEQRAVVLLLAVSLVLVNLRLLLGSEFGLQVGVGGRVATVDRGTTGSDRERRLPENVHEQTSQN